jgi:hypothetical protein
MAYARLFPEGKRTGRGNKVPQRVGDFGAELLRQAHKGDPRKVSKSVADLAKSRAMHPGALPSVIIGKRANPGRMRARRGRVDWLGVAGDDFRRFKSLGGLKLIGAGFGFGRRRHVDGAGVGPGFSPASSATSHQWPSLPFDTTPREASPRRRSPVLERFPTAAFASTFTLAPECSRIASRSRCSAAFVLNVEARRALARRGVCAVILDAESKHQPLEIAAGDDRRRWASVRYLPHWRFLRHCFR